MSAPKVRRPLLCDQICKKIGITRTNPGSPQLSKRELLHLDSFINVVVTDKRGSGPHGDKSYRGRRKKA